MIPPAELLEIATEATSRAASMMRSRSPEGLTGKGDRDYTSDVDFAIERTVREFLARVTPGIGFLGEEEPGDVDGLGEFWTLDPIDGTVNFVHSVPLCAVSLALVRGRRPVLGVIELPLLGARYVAVEGAGARGNGHPLRVSATEHLHDGVVSLGDYAVGADAQRRNADRLALSHEFARRALRVRMFGSAATDLAWVAQGRTDACLTLSNNPWDTSAGVVIAREAGAKVVDVDGSEHTFDSQATIAAAPGLLEEVLAAVKAALAG
jgi:myo-inositol-1(or 4)-monophosphatase